VCYDFLGIFLAGVRGAELSARILNGNAIRDQIYGELQGEIQALAARGIRPGLAAVLVGDNAASKLYVSSKTCLLYTSRCV